MNAQSLAYGTFILSLASFLNRIIGFAYQIALVRLIHAEGIGLFTMVFPLYVLLLVLASGGIPVAIAKLVAEERARGGLAGAYRVFRLGLVYIIVSAAATVLVVLGPGQALLDDVFANPDVRLAFVVMVPAVFVVSVCSAFRGFFQGLQQMTPTAVSQLLEQGVRVVVGLGLAAWLLPRGIAYATAGVSAGVVAGETAGFLCMLAIYNRKRPREVTPAAVRESLYETTRRIFSLAFPVTLTRFVSTGLMSIDAVLIPKRLVAAGLTGLQATETYGKLVGMAETLLFTPGILTISLSTALVPAVSDAAAVNDTRLLARRVNNAFRLTILVGVPSMVVFLLVPSELCGLLYRYPDTGAILGILALGGPFLYINQTTTGILQGLGKAIHPFKNLVIASVLKISLIFYLTGLPQWGIQGAALALACYFALMAALNVRDVVSLTGVRIDYLSAVIRPAAAGGIMAAVMWAVLAGAGRQTGGLLAALIVGLLSYGAAALLTGAMDKSHLRRVLRLCYETINRRKGVGI